MSESPEPAKIRKRIKISDVRGRKRYGNPVQGGDPIMTHPTKEDIQKAIDDGYYIDQMFSGGGNEEKLFHEWMAQAGGDRRKFIEIATRWHAGRVAFFVRNKNNDPIGVGADDSIHDGSHRILALEFRGETEVDVIVG